MYVWQENISSGFIYKPILNKIAAEPCLKAGSRSVIFNQALSTVLIKKPFFQETAKIRIMGLFH